MIFIICYMPDLLYMSIILTFSNIQMMFGYREIVDHYFLTALVKTNDRETIIVSSFIAICTHPFKNPFVQRIYGCLTTKDRE